MTDTPTPSPSSPSLLPDEVDQNAIWQKALNSAFTQFESYWRVKWTKKSLDTPEQRRKALDDCLQHAVGILRLHEFTINESKLKEERELRVKDEERHEALLAQQVKRADELLRRIAALEKERDKLGRFVAKIMEDWPEGGSFDGGDIQDIAVSCGLLIETTMQEPCGEDSSTCACLEYCGRDEWPLQCFRVSDTLKRVRALGATNA